MLKIDLNEVRVSNFNRIALYIMHIKITNEKSYLLRIGINGPELCSQFASYLLLCWAHGSLILSHSSLPQRLGVGVVLKWVQTHKWREGFRHMELLVF